MAERDRAQSSAHILVLSFSDLSRDPRVNRQLRFLSADYRVTAAGWKDPCLPGIDFIQLRPDQRALWRRILFGIPRRGRVALDTVSQRHQSLYWRRPEVRHSLDKLRAHGGAYDMILANDLDCLPIALAIAGRKPVLYDAHEFAPGQFEDRLAFRLFRQTHRSWLCHTFMPAARMVTTVSPGLADAYLQMIGTRPAVIWNAPDHEDLMPSPTRGRIRLVHHGMASRSRRIEQMIGVMDRLDGRFELNLVLVGDDRRYVQRLHQLAQGDPRIRFLPPVPMRDLPRFLNQFDIGLYLMPDTNRNLRWALPNKFFEFVQARLALAISPTHEMARLVRQHDLGVVSEDFEPESLARQLTTLDPARIAHFKQRSHDAARVLSAEPQREHLLRLVASLLGQTGESSSCAES